MALFAVSGKGESGGELLCLCSYFRHVFMWEGLELKEMSLITNLWLFLVRKY